jgi:hypothetical protein
VVIEAPTTIPVRSFDLRDRPIVFNTAMPWLRPTVGVALTDGVSEIDAAGAFEAYNVSGAARTGAIREHVPRPSNSTSAPTRHHRGHGSCALV